MDELLIFSQRLRELRASKDLTQRDFSEKLGITPASLSAYESGQKNPSVGVAIKIAKEFSVSLDWLCGLSSESGLSSAPDDREATCIRILETIGLLPTIFDVRGEFLCFKSNYDGVSSVSSMQFQSAAMSQFVDALGKLASLYSSDVLDKETYSTCVSSTAKKYGKLLSKEELTLPF